MSTWFAQTVFNNISLHWMTQDVSALEFIGIQKENNGVWLTFLSSSVSPSCLTLLMFSPHIYFFIPSSALPWLCTSLHPEPLWQPFLLYSVKPYLNTVQSSSILLLKEMEISQLLKFPFIFGLHWSPENSVDLYPCIRLDCAKHQVSTLGKNGKSIKNLHGVLGFNLTVAAIFPVLEQRVQSVFYAGSTLSCSSFKYLPIKHQIDLLALTVLV